MSEVKPMDLREFIATTISQIQQGVQDAISQRSGPNDKGAINPVWGTVDDIGPKHVKEVVFDVAVTASEQNAVGGKAGIRVLSIAQAGGEASSKHELSSVSRVQFTVPIISPVQTVAKTKR